MDHTPTRDAARAAARRSDVPGTVARLSRLLVALCAGCGATQDGADAAMPDATIASDLAGVLDLAASDRANAADLALSPDLSTAPDMAATDGAPPRAPMPLGQVSFQAAPNNVCTLNGNSKVPTTRCLLATVAACPGVADMTAYLKISEPNGNPAGTIVLGGGGGGGGFYEQAFAVADAGAVIINTLLAAGYRVVQRAWTTQPNGWLTGPGGASRLACRYATLVDGVYQTYHTGGGYCLHGNSGGAAEVGFALAHYGLGREVDFALPSSGPPFGRVDYGCLGTALPAWAALCPMLRSCNGGSCAYTGPPQGLIDQTYGQNVSDCQNRNAQNASVWYDDSVQSSFAIYDYPQTVVHFLFGAEDCSEAVPLGRVYADAITTAKAFAIVPNAQHDLPNWPSGAQAVVSELTANCQLRH